jgi:hypothetical protein
MRAMTVVTGDRASAGVGEGNCLDKTPDDIKVVVDLQD